MPVDHLLTDYTRLIAEVEYTVTVSEECKNTVLDQLQLVDMLIEVNGSGSE